MNDMKKKLNFGVLAIMGVVVFSACGSDSDLFDPEKAAAKKEAQYASAFVQKYGEIAVDQDWGFGAIKAMTRAVDANANQWGSYVDVPAPVSENEKQNVIEWFKTHKSPESISVNWSDFFIQQVYKGEDIYTSNSGSSVKGSEKMNKLCVGLNDEHANNFNNGDCSNTNVNNQYNDKIMFMINSSTERFGYLGSEDGKMHYAYTIQEIDGAYYVGFDFEATGQNPNQQVAADGYYSDWIVKISPAVYTNADRIIAEDLGDSDDFDFNDVVFDVAINGGATIITLQAAGGTLPLYIEVGGDSREVHELFGVSNTTMVNTGAGATKAPVMYRVNGTDAVNIKVEGQNAEVYTLKAEIGKAPQKIRVETRYDWTSERQAINDKYPGFADWVADPTANWY